MKEVIADAGPLIALARIGKLHLLRELYGEVHIPLQVLAELRVSENRPGAKNLTAALDAGWLRAAPEVFTAEEVSQLPLDPGEAQAILIAERRHLRFLLMDEHRGRQLAKQHGLAVVGLGGVLLIAKQTGCIDAVAPLLDQLQSVGYRLSKTLCQEILRRAEE